MTDQQRAAILEVCQHLINAGIAYAHYHTDHGQPVYPATRGLSEIEQILADANQEQA